MKIIQIISFVLVCGLTACDPLFWGTASIDNQSVESVILRYQSRYGDTTIVIPAMTKKVVLSFAGLGEGRRYPGVVREFDAVELTTVDTSRQLIKNIKDLGNWKMVNPNKRRFSKKSIDCWFEVSEEDIE